MSITRKAIQDLLDELEASKQSRLRAWNVLQRLRSVLSELGNIAIPPPAQKTFDAEGETLEHALKKSFRIRNKAIRSLCSSVRRFRDATINARAETVDTAPSFRQAFMKRRCLIPSPADRMKGWPISSRVNSPKNDDAEIIVPVED